jgi:hypothetical protein
MTANKPTLQEWMQYSDSIANITESQSVLFNKYLDEKINAYIFNTDAALRPARQPLSLVFIRAGFIKRTLGTRVAAGYLRNRSVSIETALYLLTRKGN